VESSLESSEEVTNDIWQHRVDSYVAVVAQARREMFGPQRQAWMARLEQQHDELRAVLHWLAKGGLAEEGLRLAIGLREFWNYGRWHEGREWLMLFLALPQAAARTALRAQALDDAGALTINPGEDAARYALFKESLVIRRELGDQAKIAVSLIHLANEKFYCQRDYGAARAFYDEYLALCQEIDSSMGVAYARFSLGRLACEQEDYATGLTFIKEGLKTIRDKEDVWAINFVLMDFAVFAARQQQPERALRLAGAAETLRESIKVLIPPFSARLDWEKGSLDLAWRALDKETGAALWAEGQAMTLAQAIAYALE
jgi:non-specific serine/threonine protein kinase